MYYCGDTELGSLGNTIEEAFNNYKSHVEIDCEIEDCEFHEVNPKAFFCSTKIVINE